MACELTEDEVAGRTQFEVDRDGRTGCHVRVGRSFEGNAFDVVEMLVAGTDLDEAARDSSPGGYRL